MKENDNIYGNDKTLYTNNGKTFLNIKINLLFKINSTNLICNTANYYSAFLENESVRSSYHLLYLSDNEFTLQTNRFDKSTTGGNFAYTIFIASFL